MMKLVIAVIFLFIGIFTPTEHVWTWASAFTVSIILNLWSLYDERRR